MDNVWVNTAVFVGWLLGGIIGGATGIGAIMIAMPILTMVLAPGDAVRFRALSVCTAAYIWPSPTAGTVNGLISGIWASESCGVRRRRSGAENRLGQIA